MQQTIYETDRILDTGVEHLNAKYAEKLLLDAHLAQGASTIAGWKGYSFLISEIVLAYLLKRERRNTCCPKDILAKLISGITNFNHDQILNQWTRTLLIELYFKIEKTV